MYYNSLYNRRLKRLIDLPLAIMLFILILPVYLLISIAIFLDSGRPVFYRAERGAYKKGAFKIFKFRSMINNAEQLGGGTTALHDFRITRVGRFLRKSKLDETAQLLNIILGEMSFVGPRPELVCYTSQYVGAELDILQVRPGLTDYSSLKFINLDELVGADNADAIYESEILQLKNKLRIKYAQEVSFGVDCKLFFQTAHKTLVKVWKIIFD